MSLFARRFAVSVVALASIAVVEVAADSPQQAFVKSWEGQDVVVKRTLFALVYKERGRLGNTSSPRRDGLTVVTPNQALYFQFDGRQGRDDVIERDPQKVLDAVNAEYQGDGLDVRSYRKLEALVLTRYDAGVRLIVKSVKVDRDAVRLGFVEAGGSNGPDDLGATLTVKWPVPLSKALTERPLIENLVRQFVDFPASRVRN
jgi:hypothetical protein